LTVTQEEYDPKTLYPAAPETLKETGLPESFVESLVCKYLYAVGESMGRQIERDLCLPSEPVKKVLAVLKKDQHVFYKDQSMGDFQFALSDGGRDRARRYLDESMYVGPAPVLLEHYIDSVKAQSITIEQPGRDDVREAFSDILLSDEIKDRLGPAINSGRGLFLYGFPGNGKTTIAERVTRCFGLDIWVPHVIYVDGEIIKFYDPENHVKAEGKLGLLQEEYDTRWVKIKRPTIIVGGELTMDALELQYNTHTKITEPSVQLKSNCGTLVIDDFGRQRMAPIELLNRWIVPLEKRFDYLILSNGKKIQVPFDQLIIFSTNLEPKDLVDDAFLRRIPYKINVVDPTEEEYRKLMELFAGQMGIAVNTEAVDHLVETHYRSKNRPFRCCQPRDLLLQITNFAAYDGAEPVMSPKAFDQACENYFAVM
jgi:predicted ATPase with chaperone activity